MIVDHSGRKTVTVTDVCLSLSYCVEHIVNIIQGDFRPEAHRPTYLWI